MKHFAMLALFFLLCSALQAQTSPGKDTLLFENSRALEFQITQNFSLSSFEGSTVSFKQHLTPWQAIRYGLSVSATSSKNDGSQSNSNSQTFIENYSRYSASANAYYLWYSAPKKVIYFYYGAGPIVGYSYSNDEQTTTPFPDRGTWKSVSKNKTKLLTAGIGVLCGVECFVIKDVSLCAEYNISALYSHQRSEKSYSNFNVGYPIDYNDNQTSSDGFSLTSNSVKMGLLIYF